MLRRRMMMSQGGVSLPSGYTKLEYLENDGTNYIDTGFAPNQDTRVVMDVQATSITANGWAFGARKDTDEQVFALFYYYSSTKNWTADYGATRVRKPISGVASDERLFIDFNKNVCSINDVTITFESQSFQSPVSLALFAANTNSAISGFLKAKLYSCQIYDNGTLIRDYVPAMNASGTAGLYDLVNDVFYPLQKAKEKNKISIWMTEDFVGSTVVWFDQGFQSTYPLASNLVITYYRRVLNNGLTQSSYNSAYTMSAGASRTGILEGGAPYGDFTTQIVSITSISPTEDDTYIYTF